VIRALAPILLVLLLAPCGAQAAEPLLEAETDFGVLRLVHLADFDPAPAGPAIPPPIAYADEVSTRPLAVENPDRAAERLARDAMAAMAELEELGLISDGTSGLSGLSPREFALTVVWLTRTTLDVPLTSPGIDDHSLEQLAHGRLGVCRHLARFADATFALLQPRCPAARDLRLVEYGDAFTHSWVRVVAIEPDETGWAVIETHIDLAAPSGDDPLVRLDLSRATDLWFPLSAMALDRAGLDDMAAEAWWAYIADPTAPRRSSAAISLLESLRERDAWERMTPVADEAARLLAEDEAAMRERNTGITPEQHLQVRESLYEFLAQAPATVLEGPLADGEYAGQIEADRALRESLVSFIGELEDDLARGRGRAAAERYERTQPDADAWAYTAAYADAVRRAAIARRRAGDEDGAIELIAVRCQTLPADTDAADELANAMLGRVQELRAGAPVNVALLRRHAGQLPAEIPETHLVRAELARLDGATAAVAAEYEAVVQACDSRPVDTPREQLFRLHAMVELAHAARSAGDDEAVIAWTTDALARLREAAASGGFDSREREDLAILWWDVGITLTIVDCDPELAVTVWQAFTEWAPAEPRALYGLARGWVQLARAQLEQAATPESRGEAIDSSRRAVEALQGVVDLDVPVPNAETYIRLAWFNLSTSLENAGLPWEALEVARAATAALPAEPLGRVLAARTLGMLCSGPADALGETSVSSLQQEAEALLAELPADLPEHLTQSTALAYHQLAVGAANRGDRVHALVLVESGLERFPGEAHLEELRKQLRGK